MSDFDFDGRLERLFSQPPRVFDPEGFARKVEARLEREWTLRRLLIGVAGVAGAAVTLSQTVGAGVFSRMREAAGPAGRALSEQTMQFKLENVWGEQMVLSGETLWTVAVLAGIAAALAASRWAEGL